MPGPAVESDAAWLDYVRATAGTTFHPTSTCLMGRHPTAVVDEQLRVHGMAGLRVVDASIMPMVVSGNTNATTIIIAEKAADMDPAGGVGVRSRHSRRPRPHRSVYLIVLPSHTDSVS